MTARQRHIGAAVAVSLVIAAGVAAAANDPRALDLRDDDAGRPPAITIGPDTKSQPSQPAPAASGNPLWGISLKSLNATRDRPLFSPTRRPPHRAVAMPRVEPVKAAPAEPEQPPLDLFGVVIGGNEGYAVFINTVTHDVIRLRTGEGHDGWVLQSVSGREVVLEKNHRTAVIALPQASDDKK
jgi:general secretion pathway protein N